MVGSSGFFQQLDQVACQLVGFTAGRAVADGNQLHTMLGAQPCQRVQAAVPVAAGLVRVHGGGIYQLARCIDHGHFHASSDAGVQAHHRLGASGRGQQQVPQVVAKYLDGHCFCRLPQAREKVALDAEAELYAPGPGHAFAQQIVGRPVLVAPAQM